jgi:serine/threonine-protein kinase
VAVRFYATIVKTYGKYQLLERLGEGGMAEVFLARVAGPMGVSRYVAVKRVLPHMSRDPALAEMFIDEARLVSKLSHPGIVAIQDFGIEDECYYLAMEYVEGHDLRHVIKAALNRKQPLPVECALYVAAQVARGLDYAHSLADRHGVSLQIVHRDVSPANILVSYNGDVKLTDFGVARARDRLGSTQSGTIKGKFRYMSPEQARGESIDHRSDLFALGTVLFEMLTLDAAFSGDSDVAALRRVQDGIDHRRLEQLPEDVLPVVERAMEVDLNKRYARGNELAEAAERVLRQRLPNFSPPTLGAYMTQLYKREWAEKRERMKKYDAGEPMLDQPAHDGANIDIEDGTRVAEGSKPGASKPTSKPYPPLPKKRTKRPWLVIAGVAAVAVGGAAGVGLRKQHATPTPVTPPPVTAPAFGTLVIESEPPGATVTVDGTKVTGTTPLERAGLDAKRPHVVQVTLAGYKDLVREVTVAEGARQPLLLTLVGEQRSLLVTSTPAGAQITVDGRPAGVTPAPVPIEVGKTYSIEVKRGSSAPFKQLLHVEPATPLVLQAKLDAPAPTGFGSLDLQSEPWADISIDGKLLGQQTPARGIRLPAGTHKVMLSNPGFPAKTLVVQIAPNKTTAKSIVLGQ